MSDTGGKCPICGKPTAVDSRPFCSRRCANVDLARWFGEGYAIPAVEQNDEDAAGAGNSGTVDSGTGNSGTGQAE